MQYKGELEGFPEEIVEKMLERQVEQGNKRDVSIFENNRNAEVKGFNWSESQEGSGFWCDVITYQNFEVFFKVYPKEIKETYMKYMMVSDEPITKENEGQKNFVIGKINNEYLSVRENLYQRLRSCTSIYVTFWKYAKEIEEEDTVITIPEIAKLTGIPVHLIRIKK